MPRKAKGITAAFVAKTERPGRHADGNGLYLLVRPTGSKFWVFRSVRLIEPPQYDAKGKRKSKMTEMGLGSATGRKAVSLTVARDKAADLLEVHKAGRDPLAERRAGRSAKAAAGAKNVTFQQAANNYIEAHRGSWRNPVHAKQWETTIRSYVNPKIGSLLVSDIETSHIVDVLTPIWNKKPETASRVRGRIESILGREKALKHRDGENPARWKENLDAILPRRSKVARVKHHAAMKYDEIGDFMAKLRAESDTITRALEFTILTCSRTNESLGARWDEIDLDEKTWTVPPERMKAGREHRVALSSRAIEILRQMQAVRLSDFVFPGRREGTPLSSMALLMRLRRMGYGDVTVHGFRSAFRDWASERTNVPGEVSEMALAHIVSDETERAYRRGDLLAKRFDLAEKWAEFCALPSVKGGSTVLPMRGSGAK